MSILVKKSLQSLSYPTKMMWFEMVAHHCHKGVSVIASPLVLSYNFYYIINQNMATPCTSSEWNRRKQRPRCLRHRYSNISAEHKNAAANPSYESASNRKCHRQRLVHSSRVSWTNKCITNDVPEYESEWIWKKTSRCLRNGFTNIWAERKSAAANPSYGSASNRKCHRTRSSRHFAKLRRQIH